MESKFPQYYKATPRIFRNAKELRKMSTPAEKHLWKLLRNRNLLGFKFRRQHPIYHFIADFYCDKAKLIIEVDGNIHDLKEVKKYDAEREQIIVSLGITVLRFKNEEVMEFDMQVLDKIEAELMKIKATFCPQ